MVHTMQCMPLIDPSTKAHSVRPFHLNVCVFLHFLPCIPVNRNPTSSIAAIKTSLFVLVGSYTIQAHFSSRLTLTEWTPSMSCRTDWMRLTQEWHVIPSTPNTVLVTGDAIVVFLSSKTATCQYAAIHTIYLYEALQAIYYILRYNGCFALPCAGPAATPCAKI